MIPNPALWQIRLAGPGATAQEWELFRAIERRYLTSRGGKAIPAESLRKLAVDNLRFFVRLAGSAPNPETTRWAVRNLDELETSLFIEAGAGQTEIEEFRRRLLGEDRPSRYKTAWKTKTARDGKGRTHRPRREQRDKDKDKRKDKDAKKN